MSLSEQLSGLAATVAPLEEQAAALASGVEALHDSLVALETSIPELVRRVADLRAKFNSTNTVLASETDRANQLAGLVQSSIEQGFLKVTS